MRGPVAGNGVGRGGGDGGSATHCSMLPETQPDTGISQLPVFSYLLSEFFFFFLTEASPQPVGKETWKIKVFRAEFFSYWAEQEEWGRRTSQR